jgi:hypothetical protein
MRTRRSLKGQDRLYREIGRTLARKAKEAATAPRDVPEGYEADPSEWPCPDGPHCKDPECAATKAAMDQAMAS